MYITGSVCAFLLAPLPVLLDQFRSDLLFFKPRFLISLRAISLILRANEPAEFSDHVMQHCLVDIVDMQFSICSCLLLCGRLFLIHCS